MGVKPPAALMRPVGTEGYGETADALVRQYESLAFEDVHGHVLHLFPQAPSRVLDIGAGTGRDAAGFCALGHDVTAVEPTREMRAHGQRLHGHLPIRWIDDSLPDLVHVLKLGERWDLVMLTAVWMHLDAEQRERAMERVARLLQPSGLMSLSLRHGPVPAGRRMFEVSPAETRALASRHGLATVHASQGPSLQAQDVSWSRLAFRAQR
jgi:SAM-dependent methyltransferase